MTHVEEKQLFMVGNYLKYGITMEWVYAGDPKGLRYKLD